MKQRKNSFGLRLKHEMFARNTQTTQFLLQYKKLRHPMRQVFFISNSSVKILSTPLFKILTMSSLADFYSTISDTVELPFFDRRQKTVGVQLFLDHA